MMLSEDLIQSFVKVTKDVNIPKKETTVYGVARKYNGQNYVKLDGSDLLTPVSSTSVVRDNERVIVSIKNHNATIIGNVSSPAASNTDLQETNKKVGEFDNVLANTVKTTELEAQIGRIDALLSDNVTIKDTLTASKADIDDIKAKNVDIEGKLTAHDAEINNIKADYVKTTVLDAEKATINDLIAGKASISELNAVKASIEQLDVANLEVRVADIEQAYIKEADVETILADKAYLNEAQVNNLVAQKGYITNLEADTLISNKGYITNLEADTLISNKGYITNLEADTLISNKGYITNLEADTLISNKGYITNLEADTLIANKGYITELKVNNLLADKANVSDLTAINGEISDLKANQINADYISANYAKIDLTNIKNGSIKTAMIENGAIGTAQIADSSITDAKIVGLTASKITAGTLDAGTIDVINLNAANITVGTINGQQIAKGAIGTDQLSNVVNTSINTANTNASKAIQDALDAMNKANAASTAASNAQTTANGKNTVFYQTSAPSTSGRKTNDVWFDTDDGNKMYYWNCSAWTVQQFGTNAIANASITNALIQDGTIQNGKIANLDAGKITSGYINAARIQAGSIALGKLDSTTQSYINNATKRYQKTVDLSSSTYNQNTYYPVVSTVGIPYNGYHTYECNVQLNSGSKPTWSTHSAGFTVNLIAHMIAGGWGTTDNGGWIEESSFKYCDKMPAFIHQATYKSKIVFYLRGGGKYHLFSDHDTNWTIYTTKTDTNNNASYPQYVEPTTSTPTEMYTVVKLNHIGKWCAVNDVTKIDGGKIYTGSVTADKISANAIGANQINADSIRGAVLVANSITTNMIQSKAINADKIAAGAVTADKLYIGNGNNMYATGYDTFDNIPNTGARIYYSKNSTATVSIDTSTAYYGSRCLKIVSSGTDSYVYLGDSANGYGCIPVVAGKTYIVSAWMKASASTSAEIYVVGHTAKNSTNSAHNSGSGTIGTSWTRVWMRYTAVSSYPYISIRVDNNTNGTTLWVDAIQIETGTTAQTPSEFRPAGSTVIDGARIVTGSITASQIASKTITANNLAANSVTATEINVSKLSAIAADMGKITAGELNIGNGNCVITTGGILTAKSATISGNITATTGKIGVFNINSALYTSTNAFGTTANNIYIGSSGISLGTAFKVTNNGALTCTNITATGGSIGGFTIASNNFYSQNTGTEPASAGATSRYLAQIFKYGASSSNYAFSVYSSVWPSGASAKTSQWNWYVKYDGSMYTNNITATGGSIGGCSLAGNKLIVDAAHISSVDATKITTGTLNAARIGAGSITADKLNIPSQGLAKYPSFTNWTGTFPYGLTDWASSTSRIAKVAVNGLNVIQMTTGTSNTGLTAGSSSGSSGYFTYGLNLDGVGYVAVEIKFRLTSGTNPTGAGALLDFYYTNTSGTTTYSRIAVKLNDLGTSLTTNTWYTLRKVYGIPSAVVNGQFRYLNGYLMGNYSECGTLTSKTIQFASFNVYTATYQDYLTQTWTSGTEINGGKIKTGTITALGKVTAGEFSLGNGNFVVSSTGVLTAKGATITGTLTAGAGSKIGGFTLSTSSLYTSSNSFGAASNIYLGASGLSLGSAFKVTAAGTLTATNATISGTLTAASGSKIGGFTIWSDCLKAGNESNPGGTSGFIYLGNGQYTGNINGEQTGGLNLMIGNKFGVKFDGTLYSHAAQIYGGSIGRWTIETNQIQSPTNDGNTSYITPYGFKNVYGNKEVYIQSGGITTRNKGSYGVAIVGSSISFNYNDTASFDGLTSIDSLCAYLEFNGTNDNIDIYMEGALTVPNNKSFASFNTSGVVKQICGVSSSNNIYIGSSDAAQSTGNTNIYAMAGTVKVTAKTDVHLKAAHMEFYNNEYSGTYNQYLKVSGYTAIYSNGSGLLYIDQTTKSVKPGSNGAYYLGTSSNRWGQIYSSKSSISTSDRNLKKNISHVDERYLKLMKELNPVSYMYKSQGSDRIHTGFIAQDVEDLMRKYGISDKEFGGFCKDQKTRIIYEDIVNSDGSITKEQRNVDVPGEYEYSLRYEEFIPLNTLMIQDTIKRVDTVENRLHYHDDELQSLKYKYNELKNKYDLLESRYNQLLGEVFS